MNTRIKQSMAAVALAVIAVGSARADAITGNITFTGGVTLDNRTDAGSAQKVMTWTSATGPGSPTVLADTGVFASLVAPGATASFNPGWSFNSGVVNNFWSVGGFTFNLISSQVTTETPGVGVTVSGIGTITGPAGSGVTGLAGTFTFSASDPQTGSDAEGSPIFTFQGISTLPDGGTTLMLLGVSLSGLALFRRKVLA